MTATVDDLFCGAGGSSLGAELAAPTCSSASTTGTAPSRPTRPTSSTPTTTAPTSRADHGQIRRYISGSDLLWGSPECTCHSLAKGARRRKPRRRSLFDEGPPGTPSRTARGRRCGTSCGSPSRRC